jgi:hypothetical protein
MRPLKRKAKRYSDKEDFGKVKRRRYQRKQPPYDYMKYWRVVKYWAKRKYNILTADMDMLFFLYSEDMFDKERFEEYNNVIGWDKVRLNRLIEEGWISLWREKTTSRRALYEISFRGRKMIETIYKKLNRETTISENREWNPMFRNDVDYADKVYRNYIRKMNLEIKRQRYLDKKSQQKDSSQ